MNKATKARLAGLALLCAFYSLVSCRKENLTGNRSGQDSTIVFSATINGVDWKTDSVSAFLVGDYRSHSKVMAITGFTSQRVISINIQDTTTSGGDSVLTVQQYNLGDWGNVSAFAYANNRVDYGRTMIWQQQGEAVNGAADVTASDGVKKLVSGTFQFTAKVLTLEASGYVTVDSVTVTNGVFKNIPYSFLRHP